MSVKSRSKLAGVTSVLFFALKYERTINIPEGLYGGGFADGYPDCTFVALVLEACSDTGADGLALLVPGALLLLFGGTFHPILPGFEPANVTGFVTLLETSETCEAVEGYCLYETMTHRICKKSDAEIHKYLQKHSAMLRKMIMKRSLTR